MCSVNVVACRYVLISPAWIHEQILNLEKISSFARSKGLYAVRSPHGIVYFDPFPTFSTTAMRTTKELVSSKFSLFSSFPKPPSPNTNRHFLIPRQNSNMKTKQKYSVNPISHDAAPACVPAKPRSSRTASERTPAAEMAVRLSCASALTAI
ncbi:uncharacterized protein BCR38DRAFT_119772 [Pseudomassariella vexata]|uniref:Uncharacterized protein n=1 Tax=Pseudomassariella vexata TaxID=1141098 RepID=A0A1Y2D9Z7_9PEZI|nr:uncharacterized protein BCR38DRAFT_119772 [Pseudomassariella vexata]ORY56090.1 hypothetical protein BCR38DRAFT_119772 [Pseudomassariella vexata]